MHSSLSVSSVWLQQTADAILSRNGVQLTDCVAQAESGDAASIPDGLSPDDIDGCVRNLRRVLVDTIESLHRKHQQHQQQLRPHSGSHRSDPNARLRDARGEDARERQLFAEVMARAAATGAIAQHHSNNNNNNNNNNNKDNNKDNDEAHAAQRRDDALARGLLYVFEAFQDVHSMDRAHYAPLARRGASTVGTVGWDTLLLLHFVHRIPSVARRCGRHVIDDASGQMVRSWRKLLLALQQADPQEAPEHSRRRGALAVCNGLLRTLFYGHNTHQCRVLVNLVAQSERAAELSGDWGRSVLRPAQHMTAEVVSFCYHKGRIALYDRHLDEAHAALREAYHLLPPPGSGSELQQRNKQRVRFFLTVAGVASGHVVPDEIMRTDDLIAYVFKPITEAIERGDPRSFAAAVDNFSSVLRRRGVYFLLLRAKLFCFLALLARTHAALEAGGSDSSRVSLHVLTAAYAHVVAEGKRLADENANTSQRKQKQKRKREDAEEDSNESMTTDEMTFWIAKLIAGGLVRGYISYEHKTIVLSRKEPFPTLQPADPKPD